VSHPHLPSGARRRFAAAGLSAVALAACGGKPILAPKPKVLTVDLLAAATVNPSSSGRPSPVVVRVYELKAAAPFEAADFVSLFDKDQAVLGADVVARDEFVLSPGEAMAIKRDLNPDSKFIAVMAAFRDLERAKWRAVAPLLAGKDNALSVRLEASTIQLVKR
jgi:type VI secretion system protein VasD